MLILAWIIFAVITIASLVSIGLSIYCRLIEIKKLKKEKLWLEQQDKEKENNK
ncbi:hypothetical protein [Spiroplasma sp. ald]|uniref:hypothetical protein n=1 Tax=Spiroplasma sp. ald TaxID=2490849 RepID=UPI0037DC2919